jgi:hypothetical protein
MHSKRTIRNYEVPSRTHKIQIPVARLCCCYRHKGEVRAVLVLAMKAYKGSRSIAPLILNLVTRWKYINCSLCVAVVCRSQWPRGLRRRSAVASLLVLRFRLGLWFRSPPVDMDVFLLWVLCVVRLRQADHSYRGVLPSVVCLAECVRVASIIRQPWHTRGCRAMKNKVILFYIIAFYSLGESHLDLSDINWMVPCEEGPCHLGMARPQVADGGMASEMEGSCE